LISCPIIYGILKFTCPGLDFLNRMAITFVIIIAALTLLRFLFPQKEMPAQEESAVSLDLTESKIAKVVGLVVVIITIILYLYYWDWSSPMF